MLQTLQLCSPPKVALSFISSVIFWLNLNLTGFECSVTSFSGDLLPIRAINAFLRLIDILETFLLTIRLFGCI